MTIPAYKDVDLALLIELVRRTEPARPSELYEPVGRHFPKLTADDLALTRPDGRTKVFVNMVNWARNHLRTRGLLVDEYRRWSVLPEARDALLHDLEERGVTSRERIGQFIDGSESLPALLGSDWAGEVRAPTRTAPEVVQTPGSGPTAPDIAGGSAQVMDHTEASEGGTGIRSKLIERLNALEGYEFEQLVARVLDTLGFRDTQVVGRSGDEGIDLVTYLDSPLIRAKVVVQVKRHTANVGPKDVSYLRDRWAHRADRLLFIATSGFTAGAKEVAEEDRVKPVELVSGRELADVMIEHGIGVRSRPVLNYDLDEEFFSGV